MAENMQTEEPSSHQPTPQFSYHLTPLSSHQPTPVESFIGTAEGPNNERMQQPPNMVVDDHVASSTKTGGGGLRSIAWNHIDKIKTTNGKDKAQCKYNKNIRPTLLLYYTNSSNPMLKEPAQGQGQA